MRTSIAMATHNGAAHLREQLASIAGQTRPPDELVVSDDASRDDTVAIVRELAENAAFPVSVLVNDPPLGVAGNFTRAIAACTGDLIATCDQDDVWLPRKLEMQHAGFSDPAVQLVFSDMAICDEHAKPTGGTQWERLGFDASLRQNFRGRGEPLSVLLRFNVVTGMTMMFRASLRELALPVPGEWIHDEWIALIAAATGAVRFIDEPLVNYRQHVQQRIGPARSGLLVQMRYAKQHMGDDYMRRIALRSRQAADRLEAHRELLRRGDVVELLRERAAHYEARVGPTLGGVWREWRAGNYARFGYGWKGVVQDLVLR